MQNDESTQEVQPVEMDIDPLIAEEAQYEEERDWKAEARMWRDKHFKELKRQKEQREQKFTKEEPPQPPNDDRLWEVAELIQRGFTKEDAKFIQNNGGSEALKDPNSYVSAALRTIQEQRRAEQAASMAAQGAGQSEIERQYTDEQLRNMSSEELAKILPHAEPY